MNLLNWIILETVGTDVLDYLGETFEPSKLDTVIVGTVEADILDYVGELLNFLDWIILQ